MHVAFGRVRRRIALLQPKADTNNFKLDRTYAFFHDNGCLTHCRRGFKPRLQWELRKSYLIKHYICITVVFVRYGESNSVRQSALHPGTGKRRTDSGLFNCVESAATSVRMAAI